MDATPGIYYVWGTGPDPDLIRSIQPMIDVEMDDICPGATSLKDSWLGCLIENRNWDAITALVIRLLPNLSTLTLPYYSKQDPGGLAFLPFVLYQATHQRFFTCQPKEFLLKLRHLRILSCQGRTTPLVDILPVLRLESMRSLTCSGIEVAEWHIWHIRAAPDFPHITQLSLFRADFDPSAFTEFLRKLPHLTHLSYTHYTCLFETPTDMSNMFLPCLIREGLMPSKDSLQELSLVNEVQGWEQLYSGDEPLPLGSLVGFEKLRKLDASVYTLMGRAYTSQSRLPQSHQVDGAMELSASEKSAQFVDSLPQSLEELILQDFESTHWPMMDALLEKRRKGKLRKLSTITLVPHDIMGKEIHRQQDLAKYVHEGKTSGIAVALGLS